MIWHRLCQSSLNNVFLPRLSVINLILEDENTNQLIYSTYEWYCAWRKLNSSLILSIDSTTDILYPVCPGTCRTRLDLSSFRNNIIKMEWDYVIFHLNYEFNDNTRHLRQFTVCFPLFFSNFTKASNWYQANKIQLA